MNDTTGFLVIGGLAVAAILTIGAIRENKGLPILGPIWTPTWTAVERQEFVNQPELMGPVIPAGISDDFDYSQLDYIPESDRRDAQDYWKRFELYNNYIYEAANLTRVPNNVIRAIMIVESSVINQSTNPSGCTGLMQLTIGAATDMGYKGDRTGLYTDPRQNIIYGAKYLAYQYKRFGNNWDYAFASYHFGSVHRWARWQPPIPGVDGDRQWEYIKQLVKEGKIIRLRGPHNGTAYGPIVNQPYINKTNKWWKIFDALTIKK